MTITVNREELKELETALAAYHQNLDLQLSDRLHAPSETGIQKCVQRQHVRYLLDRMRLLLSEPERFARRGAADVEPIANWQPNPSPWDLMTTEDPRVRRSA